MYHLSYFNEVIKFSVLGRNMPIQQHCWLVHSPLRLQSPNFNYGCFYGMENKTHQSSSLK